MIYYNHTLSHMLLVNNGVCARMPIVWLGSRGGHHGGQCARVVRVTGVHQQKPFLCCPAFFPVDEV